jgi:hypothetical protein
MVKLVEFEKKEIPFDVVEDVAIYMRNDPMVYRKSLFPAIVRMKDIHDGGKSPVPERCLGEVVDRAMNSYCEKYNLGSPQNVFKKGDREAIIQKLFSEELTQIRRGAY